MNTSIPDESQATTPAQQDLAQNTTGNAERYPSRKKFFQRPDCKAPNDGEDDGALERKE